MCHGEVEGKMDVAMSSSLNTGKYSNKEVMWKSREGKLRKQNDLANI